MGKGRGKNKVAKKTEIRVEKGQTKKVNLGWHMDRKENPIGAPSIHVGALVGADSLWPKNVFKKRNFFEKHGTYIVCSEKMAMEDWHNDFFFFIFWVSKFL